MTASQRHPRFLTRTLAPILIAASVISGSHPEPAQAEHLLDGALKTVSHTATPTTPAPTAAKTAHTKLTKIGEAATQYLPSSYPEPQGSWTGGHDSHGLPLIYMAGNDDYSRDNRAMRSYFEQEGIRVYDWYPTEVTDKAGVRKFQHPEWYIPYLDRFITDVIRQTGSPKVNIMTFSQSGVIAATWMKNHGGAQYVDQVVNISATLQGSPTATLGSELLPGCLGIQGCPAMSPESDFITQLTTPRDNIRGIQYTNITTRYDEMAAPYNANFMYDTGDYQNILIQNYCPGLPLEHSLMMKTTLVWNLAVQALTGKRIAPVCSLLLSH